MGTATVYDYYVAARPIGDKRWQRAGMEGDDIVIVDRLLVSLRLATLEEAQRVADYINAVPGFEAEARKETN